MDGKRETQESRMGNTNRIIVTSALPYAYSIPHLGNFVGSVLPADIYSNYLRMKGEDVIFICGSDVHGTAIEKQAIKDKTTPEKLSSMMHEKIKELFLSYGCRFTFYGSTHTEQNKEITYQIFNALDKKGYIVKVERELPYCNTDKSFLADRFIEGTCPVCGYESARGDQCEECSTLLDPKELVRPRCTICGKSDIVFKKTENIAIDLQKLQPKLEKFVAQASKNGWSKNAVNETRKYFKEGLKKRDVSRHTKWGFPVPLSGFEDQSLYVWFDAPIGYIGITKQWSENKWKDYWTGKDTVLINFMGKDNIIFHTLLFPGMLIGADLGYVLVHTVRSYEFLNWGGKKFSKSRGIGMDMADAISVVKNPDYWRFALMMISPETADTDFTVDGFAESVNKMMNGKIGNLFQRVITLAKSNASVLDGKAGMDSVTLDRLDSLLDKYKTYFAAIEIRESLKTVIEISDLGNAMMSEKEPWILAKAAANDDTAAKEFSVTMNTLIKICYYVGILMFPFVPDSSKKALRYFGLEEPTMKDILKEPKLNIKEDPKPIFEKLTDEQIKRIRSFS